MSTEAKQVVATTDKPKGTMTIGEQLQKATPDKRARLVGMLIDSVESQLAKACVNGLTVQKVKNALQRLANNPKSAKLWEADPRSLLVAINEAAGYGWEIGGVFGHCYLIPYGGSVQMQPGYRGLLDLVQRTGLIRSVVVESVREGDTFEHIMGDEERIVHTPSRLPDRHQRMITHVYAVITMTNGGKARCCWSRAEIEDHKERYSKSHNMSDSPWKTAWEQMAKKTVLTQVIRRGKVPMSMESQRIFERIDAESGDPETFDAVALTADSDGGMGDRQ